MLRRKNITEMTIPLPPRTGWVSKLPVFYDSCTPINREGAVWRLCAVIDVALARDFSALYHVFYAQPQLKIKMILF